MRWGGTFAAVVGALALLGSVGPARAGGGVVNLDRSDLLDVWGYQYCDQKVNCPYNELWYVWAGEQRVYSSDTFEGYTYWYPFHTEVGIAGAVGFVHTEDASINVYLDWFLFEPDKVTRNSSQVGMNQSDEMGFLISWHTSESSGSNGFYSSFVTNADTVQGCAGSVGVIHDGDDAKWKVQCKSRISQIAQALGVSENGQAFLADLLGKAWNKPLRIRGQGPMTLLPLP